MRSASDPAASPAHWVPEDPSGEGDADPEAAAATAAFAGADPAGILIRWASWQAMPVMPKHLWERQLAAPWVGLPRHLGPWDAAAAATLSAIRWKADPLPAAASALMESAQHQPPPDHWRRVIPLLPRWFRALAGLVSDAAVLELDTISAALILAGHAHGRTEVAVAAGRIATHPSTRRIPYDLRLAGRRPPLPCSAFVDGSPQRWAGNVVAARPGVPSIATMHGVITSAANTVAAKSSGDDLLHLMAADGKATLCGAAAANEVNLTFDRLHIRGCCGLCLGDP